MQTHTHSADDRKMALMLALLVAVMPFSLDAYLPSVPNVAQSLHADIHRIEQSLSTFVFGASLGQLIGGSISDIKGRRLIALSGLAVYIFGSLALVFTQSAEQLLSFRVVQAVGAGMGAVMSGAIIRDRYEGRKAAQMFAMIGIIVMMAPLIAPLVGSILQMIGGWRAVFVFLLLYGTAVFMLLWRFLPQTKTPQPLTRASLAEILTRYRRVLTTKRALGFLFFQAASFSSMMVFLTESPFVYMKLYQLSPTQYAWVFGCNIVMMIGFNRLTAWRLKRGGEPKNILMAGIAVQFTANVLLLTATTLTPLPPLPLLVACIMTSVGTQGLVSANTQALFMQHFKNEGGSANAILMSAQTLIGALIGLLATFLHNGTAQIMGSVMLACTVTGTLLLYVLSLRKIH